MEILQNKKEKFIISDNYHCYFNFETGFFMRYGKYIDDDPEYAQAPEMLDIELSTICNRECKHCYKSNTSNGKNMSFEIFKSIFDKLPKTVMQIAFGIGSLKTKTKLCNPDMFKIFEYCRDNQVIPNVTINGIGVTDQIAKRLSKVCGAVAVSHYNDDECFNAVQKLIQAGCKQVNIHQLLADETYNACYKLIDYSYPWDERLKGLNAIVFLILKQKGRGKSFHNVKTFWKYKKLINHAFDVKVNLGFDSCSAGLFLKAIEGNKNFNFMKMVSESCESSVFSGYINVDGYFYPCSFCEDDKIFKGLDVKSCKDFGEIWNHRTVKIFRNKLIKNKDKFGCRKCPVYRLDIKG